jgi:hypothetical protein
MVTRPEESGQMCDVSCATPGGAGRGSYATCHRWRSGWQWLLSGRVRRTSVEDYPGVQERHVEMRCWDSGEANGAEEYQDMCAFW